VKLGLMFFSARADSGADKYRLLLEASRFADRHGFCCIWTPERHFHDFGGLFPHPAITSAALAMITERVQIRAGSLISPLHDEVRIAEEWSVVDNLSRGRIAVSFGSGWNRNDFIFFPDRYQSRHQVMYSQIETVRALWRGESVPRPNGQDATTVVKIHPRPLQPDLPIWITSSGNEETFISAGRIGANLLTHMIDQDIPALAKKIGRYRDALESTGHSRRHGQVSLMLHTFVGPETETVKARVREPFREYLRSAISLEKMAAQAGGVISAGHRLEDGGVPESVLGELLDLTFERYFRDASLLGCPDKCESLIRVLEQIGVDEIACLIDFLDDQEAVLQHLPYLADLCATVSDERTGSLNAGFVDTFLEPLD
jgi:natural product biosynthesis luciferase-like monooxygenase protein